MLVPTFPRTKQRLGGPMVHPQSCAWRAAAPGLRCEARVCVSLQVRRGSPDLVFLFQRAAAPSLPFPILLPSLWRDSVGEEIGLLDGRYLLGYYDDALGQVLRLLGLCGCQAWN